MLAIAVENSQNRKTGMVSATYASQGSCPTSCPLLKNGCYAESGMVGIQTHKLNKAVGSPTEIAEAEAQAITKLSGDRPLRLHVVGDSITNETTNILLNGLKNFKNVVWSYTHAWRNVSRSSWGKVSILASCESLSDVKTAMTQGYAAAIVVSSLPADGKSYVKDNVRVIPCPNQTKGVTCVQCKLCWRDSFLLSSKSVIAFESHGVSKKKVDEKLKILN